MRCLVLLSAQSVNPKSAQCPCSKSTSQNKGMWTVETLRDTVLIEKCKDMSAPFRVTMHSTYFLRQDTLPIESTCHYCSGLTRCRIVRADNENGIARRPLYVCTDCGRFSGFVDIRGVHTRNRRCDSNCPFRL